MYKLNTVNFIKRFGEAELISKYSLKIKEHSKYKNIIQLHYDQIRSPMSDIITHECRGLILDRDDNYKIISYPYKKFFNYGESNAEKIDWSSAKIYSKIDGSICTLYYYDGKWHIASKQLPDASGMSNGEKHSFHELFWLTFNQMGYQLPTSVESTKFCYMFELMTDENRVIVPVTNNQLLLHGSRNLDTLKEIDPEIISKLYNWQLVPSFKFNTIEDVINSAKKISPKDGEGYVVVDQYFNRIKIKSPAYVALSQLGGDGFSDRRLISLCQSNEGEEVLAYFPKFKDRFLEIKALYEKAIEDTEILFNYEDLSKSRKEIAQVFGKNKFSGVLFQKLDKKITSIREGFSKYSIEALEKILIKN